MQDFTIAIAFGQTEMLELEKIELHTRVTELKNI